MTKLKIEYLDKFEGRLTSEDRTVSFRFDANHVVLSQQGPPGEWSSYDVVDFSNIDELIGQLQQVKEEQEKLRSSLREEGLLTALKPEDEEPHAMITEDGSFQVLLKIPPGTRVVGHLKPGESATCKWGPCEGDDPSNSW